MVVLACIDSEFMTPHHHEALQKYAGNRRVVVSLDRETLEREIANVEVAVGEVPRDLLAKAPRLKWYQQFGTGVDWLREHPETVEHPFLLTNCSDNHCVILADHMFALLLSFSRGIHRFARLQMTNTWERPGDHSDNSFELRGKTMLILGLGSIGMEVVKRGQAFGLRMIGIRSDASKTVDGVEKIYGNEDSDIALGQADFIANTLPHTDETHHYFDAKRFEAVKPGSYFFNVGRGGTVDETALVAALENGKLAGAGLDVFEVEPLPVDSPLWQMRNVLITPHTGGSHDRLYQCWLEVAFDNLKRDIENRPLRNVVDKRRGY